MEDPFFDTSTAVTVWEANAGGQRDRQTDPSMGATTDDSSLSTSTTVPSLQDILVPETLLKVRPPPSSDPVRSADEKSCAEAQVD